MQHADSSWYYSSMTTSATASAAGAFHEPILGNDKYEFKSVHILEVGIQISLTNDFIKCIGSKISTSFSEIIQRNLLK